MVARAYGKDLTLNEAAQLCDVGSEGTTLFSLAKGAQAIGLKADAVKLNLSELSRVPLPCILHWDQNHFVVLIQVLERHVYVIDPAVGRKKLPIEEFSCFWMGTSDKLGIALLLQPTAGFDLTRVRKESPWALIWPHLHSYRSGLMAIAPITLISNALQLALPILAQHLVDRGINGKDLQLISVLLVAQVALVLGRAVSELFNNWLLLRIGTSLGLKITTAFLHKLTTLPMQFFIGRSIGDVLKRIEDNKRIEELLTRNLPSGLFALGQLLLFSFALLIYNPLLFVVYLVGLTLHVSWVALFMSRRQNLDHKRFTQESRNQNLLVQTIEGMGEIKLGVAQNEFQRRWVRAQETTHGILLHSLSLNNWQQGGAQLIGELRNAFITFMIAQAVVQGQLTLGAMVSLQYILGQLNLPVNNLIQFLRGMQDAELSLARLASVQHVDSEYQRDQSGVISSFGSLILRNVSYGYPGTNDKLVIERLNLHIPFGRTTAIVGSSGSGKTTLLKLLLKLVSPKEGCVMCGTTSLSHVDPDEWRGQCGAVMQDGYIFSDSIQNNITMRVDSVSKERLQRALEVANLTDILAQFPKGLDTKIGLDGLGLSQGQKQRILIARAIYKDPKYLFFDEATNALDATNEKSITDNLERFLKDRTVVVIAHRLSTVKNADQIVVLSKGRIVERGNHAALIDARGEYYRLVSDQLSLAK
jgi:ATP-binding cassette, subfamily B, bacterial